MESFVVGDCRGDAWFSIWKGSVSAIPALQGIRRRSQRDVLVAEAQRFEREGDGGCLLSTRAPFPESGKIV